MKHLFITAAIALATFGAAAETATPADTPARSTQQNKMKTCNAEAKTQALKGDERKAFMKQCLSSGKTAAKAGTAGAAATDTAKAAKPNKMTTCNADAKTKALKGDERKSFMKECLAK